MSSDRPALKNRPLVFIDIETTGLDENKHEILEIAVLGEDGETLLHTAVKPEHIETASPKALEINGYNPGEWEPSPLFGEIADKVHELLSGPVIAGQNVSFDMRFVNRALRHAFAERGMSEEEVDAKMESVSYHLIDTVTLAYEHLAPGGLRSLSLWAVCKWLGIVNKKAHSALSDIRATREVYYALYQATSWDRFWWRILGPRRMKVSS
jgi:DNA polymerase-3 subunit epsilon